MAKAMSKVSEIMACCLLMIVPALIGYLIDSQVGTRFVFTLLGLVFGMVGAVSQLIRLVSVPGNPSNDSSESSDESTEQT